MAEGTTALTSLPPELLSAIAEQVEPRDLLPLRTMCKKLEAASFDSFTEVFFSKRTHLYSCYGLQAMVDITAQPDFAMKIREVEFVCAKVDMSSVHECKMWLPGKRLVKLTDSVRNYWDLDDTLRLHRDRDAHGADGAYAWYPGGEKGTTEYRVHTESERAVHKRHMTDMEKKLHERGPGLVQRILTNLQYAGTTPDIALWHPRSNLVLCFGATNMMRLFGLPADAVCRFEESESVHASDAILAAMTRTDYPVQSLAFTLNDSWRRGPALLHESTYDSICFYEIGPFTNLTTFYIDFHDLGNTPNFVDDLGLLWECMPVLHHLSLCYSGYDLPDNDVSNSDMMLKQCPSNFMGCTAQSIELRYFRASAQAYIDFFSIFVSRLKRLSLHRDGMIREVSNDTDGGYGWSVLLRWCAENLELDHIQLDGLYIWDRDDDDYDYDNIDLFAHDGTRLDHELDGTTQIAELLSTLASSPQYLPFWHFEDKDDIYQDLSRRV